MTTLTFPTDLVRRAGKLACEHYTQLSKEARAKDAQHRWWMIWTNPWRHAADMHRTHGKKWGRMISLTLATTLTTANEVDLDLDDFLILEDFLLQAFNVPNPALPAPTFL